MTRRPPSALDSAVHARFLELLERHGWRSPPHSGALGLSRALGIDDRNPRRWVAGQETPPLWVVQWLEGGIAWLASWRALQWQAMEGQMQSLRERPKP